jgi:hypothetical protein
MKELSDFAHELHEFMDEKFWNRSDKWQESERGLDFELRMDKVEEIADMLAQESDELLEMP